RFRPGPPRPLAGAPRRDMSMAARKADHARQSTRAQHLTRHGSIDKIATGIPGFDFVAGGGLPESRATLVAGTAGSAKTVFVSHFLAAGLQRFDESGVFVTFEDSPTDIRRNVLGFGWDIDAWEAENKWAFVDVSPDASGPVPV